MCGECVIFDQASTTAFVLWLCGGVGGRGILKQEPRVADHVLPELDLEFLAFDNDPGVGGRDSRDLRRLKPLVHVNRNLLFPPWESRRIREKRDILSPQPGGPLIPG